MKKFLFLIALFTLMGGANSVKAETEFEFDAFGKGVVSKSELTATGGLTYDPSTGVLSSDGTAGSLVLEFATPVDMRNLFQFNVTQSGQTGDILSRLEFYDKDNALINTWNSIKLGNTWDAKGINNDATNAFLNHNPVKKMVWPSDAKAENNGKTATITSIEFTLKTISCAKAGEKQLKTLPYNTMAGASATPAWNVSTSTDTYYGTSEGTDAVSYVDVTEYSELRIFRDNNTGFRAFFVDAAGKKVNNINHENAASSWNAEGKYWSIDLSKVEQYEGKVALQSIKSAGWGQNNIVNNIVVYKTPADNAPKYSLSGSGMQLAETVAALADATVTCIDATGVIGITTNSEAGRTLLTSANPNCLFLGTTGNGALANTQNVVTSGTCANLVLTDGNYPFKAPADFTATSVSYNRNFTAGTRSTVCLPFALTAAEAEAAGTFYELSGVNLAGTELEFTDVTASGTTAYKPYIFEAKTDGTPFTGYSSKDIVATPATFTGETVDGYTLTGVLAGSSDVAADNEGKTVYGWSGNDGKEGTFVKVGTGVAINPFRAYVVYNGGGASARMAARFVGDSVTGIDEVSETQNVLNPDRKYIENGKIVIVKNGVKYNAAGQLLK